MGGLEAADKRLGSGFMWRVVEEKLLTEPGRVLRGVDREADGAGVVEDFEVVSSLQTERSR